MKILLFGTFDNLHLGHKFVLDSAKERGDVFVVVARDNTVKKLKGFFPKQSETERMQAIKNDYPSFTIILGDETNYMLPVKSIKPDLILLGYDQKLPNGIKMEDLPCDVERMKPFEEKKWKSSLLRGKLKIKN